MQPDLTVADFFKFGTAAAAQDVPRGDRPVASAEPVDAEWSEVDDAD